MTPNQRQEALTRAFVDAVAAQCGATISTPSGDFGIDRTLAHVERRGAVYTESGVKLDVQLKSTMSDEDLTVDFAYDLDVRAYEALRRDTRIPRLLLLLLLPTDPDRWTSLRDEGLVIHRRAFWLRLQGRPATSNRRSVRVTIPAANVFGPASLQELFERTLGEEAL